MKLTNALLALLITVPAWAQMPVAPAPAPLPSAPMATSAVPAPLPTSTAGLAANPAGSTLPSNNAGGNPAYSTRPADGAIQTPDSMRQSEDSIINRQSAPNRGMRQEEQFDNRVQGTLPRAIPSQGIGIPDPMNPNPNVPNTVPTPLPQAQ